VEGVVLHAEGLEEAGGEEPVEGLAARDFDDVAEGVEGGAGAVDPAGAGLERERGGTELGDGGGERPFVETLDFGCSALLKGPLARPETWVRRSWTVISRRAGAALRVGAPARTR
jgi:hypothetical protein